MIAVAILGILAAVALPAWRDYTVRAKVTEGLSLAGPAKILVIENASSGAAFSSGLTSPNLTRYVQSVQIDDAGGQLVWNCNSADQNPLTHHGTLGTLRGRYAPGNCSS